MKKDVIKTESGNLVDIHKREIYGAEITITNDRISEIKRNDKQYDNFIIPGFIDAHIHIESSLLPPSEFARIAVKHGTIAAVCDPHEIANVMGVAGIDFMIKNAEDAAMKFYFGVPSSVPATTFETAGGAINLEDAENLLDRDEIKFLSEVMNFPAVCNEEKYIIDIINAAKERNKPIDGHAPGLRGERIKKYFSKGISTDHECTSLEEALEKLAQNVYILIREGGAVRNFEALKPLIKTHPDRVMFCSDDIYSEDIFNGHINLLVKRAIAEGNDLFDVLRIACANPTEHYKLDVGLLREGDLADFLIVNNLEDFIIEANYINGNKIYNSMYSLDGFKIIEPINNFKAEIVAPEDFRIPAKSDKIRVIELIQDQIETIASIRPARIVNGFAEADIENDILKITVLSRYAKAKPFTAFIKGFGIKKGAIAGSIAHDSHNIIAIGCDDESLCKAVNGIINLNGGLCAYDGNEEVYLPLRVGGLMSNLDIQTTSDLFKRINTKCTEIGSKLDVPFMTLSFMALLVIPELKISDKGLFDVLKFDFVDLFV